MERNSLLSTLQLTNKTYNNSKKLTSGLYLEQDSNQLDINNLTEEQILKVSEKLTSPSQKGGPSLDLLLGSEIKQLIDNENDKRETSTCSFFITQDEIKRINETLQAYQEMLAAFFGKFLYSKKDLDENKEIKKQIALQMYVKRRELAQSMLERSQILLEAYQKLNQILESATDKITSEINQKSTDNFQEEINKIQEIEGTLQNLSPLDDDDMEKYEPENINKEGKN